MAKVYVVRYKIKLMSRIALELQIFFMVSNKAGKIL